MGTVYQLNYKLQRRGKRLILCLDVVKPFLLNIDIQLLHRFLFPLHSWTAHRFLVSS